MLSQITTISFRNLKEQTIYPAPGINFVLGDNGSGKTSLLEAINLIATGRSFRSRSLNNLIQFEQKNFTVFVKNTEQTPIGFQLDINNKIQFKLNGEAVKRLSDIASHFPLQYIPADSHQFFSNGPKFRRQILDWGVFHVKHDFNYYWQSYKKAIQQRNAALKNKLSKSEITLWDNHIDKYAQSITDARKTYLDEFLVAFETVFKRLCSEFNHQECSLKFNQGWQKHTKLIDNLAANIERDRAFGYTRYGAHSADWTIKIAGNDPKEMLSRGQQKLFFLSIRIAQLQLFKDSIDAKRAVLLIDDISSELDLAKQKEVIDVLKNLISGQVFLTSTNLNLSKYADEKDKVFHVKHGEILESDS